MIGKFKAWRGTSAQSISFLYSYAPSRPFLYYYFDNTWLDNPLCFRRRRKLSCIVYRKIPRIRIYIASIASPWDGPTGLRLLGPHSHSATASRFNQANWFWKMGFQNQELHKYTFRRYSSWYTGGKRCVGPVVMNRACRPLTPSN